MILNSRRINSLLPGAQLIIGGMVRARVCVVWTASFVRNAQDNTFIPVAYSVSFRTLAKQWMRMSFNMLLSLFVLS